MHPFLFGMIAAQSLIIALFFLKFWMKSSDRLFLWFAIAFLLLAAERLALNIFVTVDEPRSLVYVLRLLAFGLITFAVIDKNKRSVSR